ncbi:MAG: crossover junction endodeoxyribonuclease RuvC [bacterium]
MPKHAGEIILGFDPGTQVTGWGAVQNGRPLRMLGVGIVRPKRGEPLELRLKTIYDEALLLIDRHKPSVVVVEDPFVGKSVSSALALGQARGVLLLAAAQRNLPVVSYSPRSIKAAVVGRGSASKEQVAFMVRTLLGLREAPQPLDASDALAVALCHLNKGTAMNTGGSREPVDIARLVKNPQDLEAVQRWKSGKGRKAR